MATVPKSELDLPGDEEPMAGKQASFPRSWRWETDGELVSGRYLRFDSGPTRGYGRKPIIVLDLDGEERSIWLMQDVLYNRFRDELIGRPGRKLTVGERIVIRRLGEKTSEESGRTYRAFSILFPDRPETSPETLFDLPSTGTSGEANDRETASELAKATDGNNQIPF
jgi:hypothetical protein